MYVTLKSPVTTLQLIEEVPGKSLYAAVFYR
jgi:hypothetical protein